jgi:multidrug efflux pump subunit AcrB
MRLLHFDRQFVLGPYYRLPENKGRPIREVAVEAVDEVGNPTILATFAVIAAILPMAFVGGLMGPYMKPIPVGATAAMLFSLLVAFIVTPWASVRLVKKEDGRDHGGGEEGRVQLAGEIASLLLSRMTVPVLYYLSECRKHTPAETVRDFSESGDSTAENHASAEVEVAN